MKKECIISGVLFDTKDPQQQVSPVIAEAILNIIKRDESLQRRVSAEILGNADSMKEMARHVMAVRASDIGLSYPGTLGEFFRECGDTVCQEKA
jgi:hypothetical protein